MKQATKKNCSRLHKLIIQAALQSQLVDSVESLNFSKIARESGLKPNSLRAFFLHYTGRRGSEVLKRLCAHFGIPKYEIVNYDDVPELLKESLIDTWDGTSEHAVLLNSLIRAGGAVNGSMLSSIMKSPRNQGGR